MNPLTVNADNDHLIRLDDLVAAYGERVVERAEWLEAELNTLVSAEQFRPEFKDESVDRLAMSLARRTAPLREKMSSLLRNHSELKFTEIRLGREVDDILVDLGAVKAWVDMVRLEPFTKGWIIGRAEMLMEGFVHRLTIDLSKQGQELHIGLGGVSFPYEKDIL